MLLSQGPAAEMPAFFFVASSLDSLLSIHDNNYSRSPPGAGEREPATYPQLYPVELYAVL